MKSKIKVVIIAGPTAVGKSDYTVEYAIKHNGEVISADSRQVYKGLDIGTGKITEEEMKGIPHHLLDVANPKSQFNVEKYKVLAQKAILDISSRGKLPIICGGTGFYIDAVINNTVYPNVPHNIVLRKKFNKINASELFIILKKLDSRFAKSLNNSEQHNAQRLIRAIEIATALGKVPKVKKGISSYIAKWIILKASPKILRERIDSRLMKRFESGMIEEVESLHNQGLSWKRMDELGLEYRFISRYLRKLITKEKMIEQLKNEIWHYAKRQILWFRRG